MLEIYVAAYKLELLIIVLFTHKLICRILIGRCRVRYTEQKHVVIRSRNIAAQSGSCPDPDRSSLHCVG
jgi:hypothetical protein